MLHRLVISSSAAAAHARSVFHDIDFSPLSPLLSANTLVFSKATLVSPWCRKVPPIMSTLSIDLTSIAVLPIFLSRKSEARRRTVTCNRKNRDQTRHISFGGAGERSCCFRNRTVPPTPTVCRRSAQAVSLVHFRRSVPPPLPLADLSNRDRWRWSLSHLKNFLRRQNYGRETS